MAGCWMVWKSWDIEEWGHNLLEHFFLRRHPSDAAPVASLLVTAEELSVATGDNRAQPEEVRSSFVHAVLSGVGGITVMEHAYHAHWSPEVPNVTPPIMAHLLLSCLAASESTDDFADEGSFIRRLNSLTQDQSGRDRFGRLEELPNHWRRFARWLEAGDNPSKYRRLRLPDPGHLTRIGYTVNLAFPDRRDQQVLAGLLADNKLDQENPPLARVMAIVAEHRSSFKRSFQRAFDEFRQLSETAAIEQLFRHRFWAAVIAASRRGRTQLGSDTPNLKRQLLAWVTDDLVTFCVVSQQSAAPDGFRALPLPAASHDYGFVILPDSAPDISEEAIATSVGQALAGKLRVWVVSVCLRGGVIPFGFSTGNQLECLIHDDLEAAVLALVRTELALSVLQYFGGRTIECSIPGWVAIVDCRLRRLASAELESGPLATSWLLHATVPRPSLRLSGGVRTEDGWLGNARLLPRVRFDFNAQLFLRDGQTIKPLVRSNDYWELPQENLSGTHELSAISEGELLDVQVLRFHASPALEDYKSASAPAAWLCEGLHSTWQLDSAPDSPEPPNDAAPWTEFRAFLGANVGEFKPDESGAVWTALRRSGRTVVARCHPTQIPPSPETQNSDKGANRRWKKILTAELAPEDSAAADARNSIWKIVNSALPKAEHGPAPTWVDYHPEVATPHPNLNDFIAVVAARACSVAGITLCQFEELARIVLGTTVALESHFVRSWMDAGLIDVGQFVRWNVTKVFARLPVFLVHRDGMSYIAVLSGLVLERTREVARRAATTRGLSTWNKRGFSPYTPDVICIRSSDINSLIEIAAATGHPFRLATLDLETIAQVSSTESGKLEPGGYHIKRVLDKWTVNPRASATATLTMKLRPDAPAIWIAPSGEWSYSLNRARLLACAHYGEQPFAQRATNELDAHRAYLPVPLARVVALVGQALPGPTLGDNFAYRYSFPTEKFRQVIMDTVVSRLHATHPIGA